MEFVEISVKCFNKCNLETKIPEFVNKPIQVIKGTESQETLNFEQIANAAAQECYQLVEIEIKTFDSCDPDTHKPLALKEPKKIKVLPGMESEVKAIFDQMFEIQGEQCDVKPDDVNIVEISVQTVIGCNQDRTPILRDRTIHCPKKLEAWLIYQMASLANIESKLCLITGEVGDVGGNILNEVRDIGSNLIDALETTASLVGKGFNAFQDDGLLSENNWLYAPVNIPLKSGMLKQLSEITANSNTEGLDAADTITNTPITAKQLAAEIKQSSEQLDNSFSEAITNASTERTKQIQQLNTPIFNWEALL